MKERINLFMQKIKNLVGHSAWSRIVFIAVGISSTIWFLIRVIPKPQRATYPCMRAAAPFMSGFIVYILSLGGLTLLFKRTISKLKQAKYKAAIISVVLFVLVAVVYSVNDAKFIYGNTT